MIAAACTALAVLALSAAVRPRPVARGTEPPARAHISLRWVASVWRQRLHARPIDAADVAAWCETMARVVRGGASLGTAIRTTEPPDGAREPVARVVLALERGSRLAEALRETTPSAHLNLALAVLRACALNGGPPAEPLDRTAATLRGRAADAAERRTQSAQARLSALVMTVLPVAMLALLLVTSPATRSAATGAAGLVAVTAGIALNLGGWRWMRHIIGRAGS